jgi:hypothetical protein
MNDEDVVMVDSVKRDVDRDIDHGGELVINADGIHLIERPTDVLPPFCATG